MAWHIFKKDLILLWPVACLGVIAQFVLAGLVYASDTDASLRFLKVTASLFTAVVVLAIAFTVALGVQQEPIPGTRQDWLTRPIRRTDLVAAKLLFVLLAVHLPMLLSDLIMLLVRGFPVGEAIGAAVMRNLNLFVALTLPTLGFAAMTRNVGQFVGAWITYFIGVAVTVATISLSAHFAGQEQATNPLAWTGVNWIPQVLGRVAMAVGVLIALQLLYSRRRVILARIVLPAFALAAVLTTFVPWSWLFAVQQAVAEPAAPSLTLAFDPAAPRYRPAPGENINAYAVGAGQVQLRGRAAGDIPDENRARTAQQNVTVFAPLSVGGLPAGAMPWADRAVVRLKTASGQVVFEGRGDTLRWDQASAARGYEAIRIPALVYDANKDRLLSLEIDYSLSLLQPLPVRSAPALDAAEAMPGFGRCTTGRDEDGDEIALRCTKTGRAPSCLSARLEDPASGRKNPDTLICAPDYAPVDLRYLPDALSRFEVEAPFRDRLGLAAYPVGAAQLGSARIVVTPYKASAHGVRRVKAEGVRLSNWIAG